ncbi:MAG: deoxyribose-phosphate aldolase [Candidatus Marinimicrobia bacterium]|jgi:deoxyribose-phosphate aldolase|nr:deoxyribose-phosphate aldolase [Candidatus Neomarinimicrobiota bacterium]MDD5710440.1 deoxyribose-phosphate aldolase [Candidatus Neomarinimicrobiota bacterium]MDX9777675.1 deoxyribose-phosphate aldolase [bacterium]
MELAKYIDHTLLKADSCKNDLDKICTEALDYGFAAVCVNSCNVAYCAEKLKGSGIKVASVIGFPLGASLSLVKEIETMRALVDGADEFDMVINIGALKDRDDEVVLNDIRTVVHAAEGKTVKVIIETCLLSQEEKVRACQLALKAGANFVKTSTGFGKGGATVEDVRLMKETVGKAMEVKASGGVRSFEDAMAMIKAGATRIGTSSGVAILNGEKAEAAY